MSLVFQLTYQGTNGSALQFVQEMEGLGLADRIRQKEGNLGYTYYQSLSRPEEILLVDEWADQEALDRHHASPEMAKIMALREKYQLTVTAKRLISDDEGIPEADKDFITN